MPELQMRFDPDKHWREVLATPGLAPIAYRMAQEYLNRRHLSSATVNPTAFTTPIEDEETEAAFRAYLAETAILESEAPPE